MFYLTLPIQSLLYTLLALLLAGLLALLFTPRRLFTVRLSSLMTIRCMLHFVTLYAALCLTVYFTVNQILSWRLLSCSRCSVMYTSLNFLTDSLRSLVSLLSTVRLLRSLSYYDRYPFHRALHFTLNSSFHFTVYLHPTSFSTVLWKPHCALPFALPFHFVSSSNWSLFYS